MDHDQDDKKKRPGQQKYIPIPGPGRDTALTPEVQEIIVKKIRRGNYPECAARAAGIRKSTFYDWLARGRKEPGSIYEAFSDAIEQAEAEWEESDVNLIHLAAHGAPAQYDENGNKIRAELKRDPKMAAWRLARRRPQSWGKTEKHELTGKDGAPLNFTDYVKLVREKRKKEKE